MMNKKYTDIDAEKFNNLIKEISDGKRYALDDFYSLYGRLISSVAISIVKSPSLVNEVVNDVLIRIWRASKNVKYIKKPVAWLYVVTYHCAISAIKFEKPYEEIFDVPQEDKNIEDFLSLDSFYSKISFLSAEEQQIIVMRFAHRSTFKTIAKELNRKFSSVTSAYYRAIDKIEKNLRNL